jgi:hypothetical protein
VLMVAGETPPWISKKPLMISQRERLITHIWPKRSI